MVEVVAAEMAFAAALELSSNRAWAADMACLLLLSLLSSSFVVDRLSSHSVVRHSDNRAFDC